MRRASQINKEPTVAARLQPRLRDEKKITDVTKQKNMNDENVDSLKGSTDDVYEFKPTKALDSLVDYKNTEPLSQENEQRESLNVQPLQTEEGSKRNFSDISDTLEESGNDDDFRRKKRKDDSGKEMKVTAQLRTTGQGTKQVGKLSGGMPSKSCNVGTSKGTVDRKSPCTSPKPGSISEGEIEDGKSDLKVPPLKIVIPQSTTEQESGQNRNGKSNAQRSQALPYVVPSSNSSDNSDKDNSGGTISPTEVVGKIEDKKDSCGNNGEDQAVTSQDPESSVPSVSTCIASAPASVELHPRKRKMKTNKDLPLTDTPELLAVSEMHPHEQPITNCYQLFLNIRKQIEKRRKSLFPVQPKPPQGFKDYLMNRCTYVLAGNSPTTPNVTYPSALPPQMKDIFTEQEKERYRLRMQHVIEKEKLVLSVEQEILRVHGKAARALANQSLPFSVCTILRDEEVYNLITPEQEEKDRNARSRYNGRLFLSWLQDVDDKWEKIKENMLLRHHNEAESLHSVQKMDWEWKLKELNLCDAKSTPNIEEVHVPMVHVSDDFDLLPA